MSEGIEHRVTKAILLQIAYVITLSQTLHAFFHALLWYRKWEPPAAIEVLDTYQEYLLAYVYAHKVDRRISARIRNQ